MATDFELVKLAAAGKTPEEMAAELGEDVADIHLQLWRMGGEYTESDAAEDEKVGPYFPLQEWETWGLKCRISRGFESFNGYVQVPVDKLSRELVEELRSIPERTPDYGPDAEGWMGFSTGFHGDYWDEEVLSEHFSHTRLLTGRKMREMAKQSRVGRKHWTMERLHRATSLMAQQLVMAMKVAGVEGL